MNTERLQEYHLEANEIKKRIEGHALKKLKEQPALSTRNLHSYESDISFRDPFNKLISLFEKVVQEFEINVAFESDTDVAKYFALIQKNAHEVFDSLCFYGFQDDNLNSIDNSSLKDAQALIEKGSLVKIHLDRSPENGTIYQSSLIFCSILLGNIGHLQILLSEEQKKHLPHKNQINEPNEANKERSEVSTLLHENPMPGKIKRKKLEGLIKENLIVKFIVRVLNYNGFIDQDMCCILNQKEAYKVLALAQALKQTPGILEVKKDLTLSEIYKRLAECLSVTAKRPKAGTPNYKEALDDCLRSLRDIK